MSSVTTFRAVPVTPPPPPVYVNDVSGAEAVSVGSVLGPGGGRLLRDTFAALAADPTGGRLTLPAGVTADHPALEPLLGWTAEGDGLFTKTIAGRRVEVRAGDALDVRFGFTVQTVGQRLPEAERARQVAEFQPLVNRQLNTVLAHAVTTRLREQVKASVPVTLQNTVRQRQTVGVTNGQSTYRGQIHAFGERQL